MKIQYNTHKTKQYNTIQNNTIQQYNNTMSKRVRFNQGILSIKNTGTIIPNTNTGTKLSENRKIIHLPNFDYYTNSRESLLYRVDSAKRKAAECETNNEKVIKNTAINAIIHKEQEFNTITSAIQKEIIDVQFVGSRLQYSKSIIGTDEIMRYLELAILMSGQRKMYAGVNNLLYYDKCYPELIKIVDPSSIYNGYCFTLQDGIVNIICL